MASPRRNRMDKIKRRLFAEQIDESVRNDRRRRHHQTRATVLRRLEAARAAGATLRAVSRWAPPHFSRREWRVLKAQWLSGEPLFVNYMADIAPPGGLLTPKQAADLMGTTEKNLKAQRFVGQGPVWLKVGRVVRYRREVIENWCSRLFS